MPYQRIGNGSSADTGPQAITTVVNSIEAGLEAVEAILPDKASNASVTAAQAAASQRANHTGTQTASTISDFDTRVRTNRLDQMSAPTTPISLGGQKLTNLGAPTDPTDAVTKAYAQSLIGPTAGTQGIYNVKSYGAVGDGVTNDTSAINAACAALNASSNGGVLYFPAGWYVTDGGHTVNVGAIVGQGQRTTTILGNGTAHQFTIGQQVLVADFMMLSNPYYVGGAAARPSAGSAIRVDPSYLKEWWAGDIHIRNVMIYGFYDCLNLTNTQRFVIHGSFIGGAVRYNIYLRNPQWIDLADFCISDTHINSNTTDTSAAHLRWESGGGARITNCKIMGGVPICIDMVWNAGTSGDINVSNCSIENFTQHAIKLTTAGGAFQRGAFTGNQIASFEGGDAGIYLDGASGALQGFAIAGNQFTSLNRAIVLRNVQGVGIAGNQSFATTFLDKDVNSTMVRNLDV